MIVRDEKIEMTQATPTGVMRINDRVNPIAKINGIDERVDADVAIVDTGIARVADLNVVGGYNCSTSDRTAWRDVEGHGTHVAGTVGAIDNGSGVVGVAPGVRLWAVKILNDSGAGLLSWYVCGLDWITAQRDPNDSSRPLIEAVNMSVAKAGSRRRQLRDDERTTSSTQAICRLVASGVTVVAAAGNDHASAASPRSCRLQRGDHRVGTRRHGRDARRAGRPPLLLVGRLRQSTTRSPTSATTGRTST